MCFGLLILGVCWAGWLPAGAARPLKASLSVCSQISAGRTPQVLAGPLPPSLGSCPLQSTSLLLALGRACGSQPSLLLWPHITRASGSAIF